MIINTILKAYDTEWQRTRDIESKASNSVGFVGVIFSLTIITLSSIIVSTDEVARTAILFSSIYSPIMIFIILSLMFLSIFFGIKALSVKEWWFLKANNFIEYCKSEVKSSDDLLKIIIDEYVNGTKTNDENNTKMASDLKISHIFFLLSIFIVIIYFIFILNLVYKIG